MNDLGDERPILGKAVIPVAGLGTRLLPATMAVPKALLPVGREPILLMALREVLEAGISEVAVVVDGKDELIERFLFGKPPAGVFDGGAVDEVAAILSDLEIALVRQPGPRGVGDALGRARAFVGGDPFAVLLPDNVFFGPPGALVQLLPVFERRRAHVTGLIEVTAGEAPAFGNCGDVRLERIGDGEYRVLELGDKGPGFLSMAGGERRVRWYARHILLPSFFDYLERFGVEKGGEVDDVPVFKAMVEEEFVVGKVLRGKGFDAGNERGLLAAQCYRWKMESESWS